MANLITFDGLSIPNGEITENFENIENIQKSEAATDTGTVTRLCKLTLNVTSKLNGVQYEAIKQKSMLTTGLLEYRGETKRARLRISNAKFEKYSEEIEGIDGLWTISYSIIEV